MSNQTINLETVRELFCREAFVETVDVMSIMNFPQDKEVTWDELMELNAFATDELGRAQNRLYRRWLNSNKHRVLGYTNKTLSKYLVNNAEFDSLHEAETERDRLQQEAWDKHFEMTTTTVSIPTDAGEMWVAMCPGNCSAEYASHKFNVFNHVTGTHETFDNAASAQEYRLQLINQFVADEGHPKPILGKYVFQEDGTSYVIEPLE